MIILNKDKPQKNEYIFLDELKQTTSPNKKKNNLNKKFMDREKTDSKEKKNKYRNSN